MDTVSRNLFRALHEGKWLSIEYKNLAGQVTCFWGGVKGLNPRTGVVRVDGMHLHDHTVSDLSLHIEGIRSAKVVEGTWCQRNEALLKDIAERPHLYTRFFTHITNLKILDYLAACNQLDSTPYKTNYQLIHKIDGSRFHGGRCPLTEEQFAEIVARFQQKTAERPRPGEPVHVTALGLNQISLNTRQGLYVLAYRPLQLDVLRRQLVAKDIVLCREFCLDYKNDPRASQSIRSFLDGEDLDLLDDVEQNLETIKDKITRQNPELGGVDDMPYLVAIGRDCLTDLQSQYNGILALYQGDAEKNVPVPIRAFFGELTKEPPRRQAVPLALLDDKVNLDQLLAMNHAFRNQLAYVQGPPGTGKTNTILNVLVTAFFNERTVLFASYNNHPIDSVVERLQNLEYKGQKIPFPIIRLGNNAMVRDSIAAMRALYTRCQQMQIFEETLDRNKKERTVRARELARLLKRYEVTLELQERKETLERLLEARGQMDFQVELLGQLDAVKRKLAENGTVTTEDALQLLDRNYGELYRYLNFTSARYIRRLADKRNAPLRKILESPQEPEALVQDFNKYLSDPENLKNFIKIFPIVATTCSSAYKLGDPEPLFDMVVMDEASQCNTAVSLVPVLRGRSLLLVGDPQQLSPVVVLDPKDNEILRRKYGVTEEYDYIQNSIYKCFLACDAVSDEVLLSYHYRCHEKIIDFNNRKYYNHRLHIASHVESDKPLVYVEVKNDTTTEKNTAPGEVEPILRFLQKYPDKSVGIITPFARQRALIEDTLRANGITDASCGTVHAFQGDEKDVVIFSLALTNRTQQRTYNWLKNNKELINVAVSRAREQLVILSNSAQLDRLHGGTDGDDDLYELVQYTRTQGESQVSEKPANSRALGIKPYSTRTESAFLDNLNHALDNALLGGGRCTVHKEVPISQVFTEDVSSRDLFYTGRFDFVVYQKLGRQEIPVLAIELDGLEHHSDPAVQARDRQKDTICREHGFELIRVENSYARRYHYIKDILIAYFKNTT